MYSARAGERKDEMCQHNWVANSGRGGVPDFRRNRMMHPTEPLMHVQCSRCNARTWLTEPQWLNERDAKEGPDDGRDDPMSMPGASPC